MRIAAALDLLPLSAALGLLPPLALVTQNRPIEMGEGMTYAEFQATLVHSHARWAKSGA